MKNYIMHHINIIIIALRVLVAVVSAMVIFNIAGGIILLIQNDPEAARDFVNETFTVPSYRIREDVWFASAFSILYGMLLIYLIYGIIRFYKCLLKIEKGKMFYNEQGEDFRKAGSAVIIFAKAKYLLFCIIGVIVYFDIPVFFKQMLPFLGVYLIGKLLLLMSYIAEKGEFIQEENELTI